MGEGVAVGVEVRPLWIRERRLGAGRNCCCHLGVLRGSVQVQRTGWASGDGETWRLTGESAEQLYRDLSWDSVVLSCTVTNRAAQGSRLVGSQETGTGTWEQQATAREQLYAPGVVLCVGCMNQSPFVCVATRSPSSAPLCRRQLAPSLSVTVTVTVGLLLSTSRCSPTRAAHAVVQAVGCVPVWSST